MNDTKIETNELGQTVLYLSKEDWEDYGKQAGFFPEITKEANTEEETTSDTPTSTDAYNLKLAELSEEIQLLKSQLNTQEIEVKESSNKNSLIDNTVLIKEDNGFNEENYPNLLAQQNQEGLIGAFAPRP